jgi:hypothetical protein
MELNNVESDIWTRAWFSVNYSVEDSVTDSVNDSIWNSVHESVWNSVHESVWNSVDSIRFKYQLSQRMQDEIG